MTPNELRIAALLSDDFNGRDLDKSLREHIDNGMVEHLAAILATLMEAVWRKEHGQGSGA